MKGQDQIGHELADLLDLRGTGLDLHAFLGPGGAAGDRRLHALDLHHAHAARTHAPEFLDMAQVRNVDPTVAAASTRVMPSGTDTALPSNSMFTILVVIISSGKLRYKT